MHGSLRFSRIELAIGPEALERLQSACVTIVGLGGVGGIAAETLARSGVGKLRIIDTDTIQESNINRQIIALDSTVGLPKVDVMAARLADINPEIRVEKFAAFFHADTADGLLGVKQDFVIDAIDAVLPKTELITFCHARNIPVISAMGAAFKKEFSRIRIADISETRGCPLARVIRRRLRRRGIDSGVTVVYSDEPGPPNIPLDESENPDDRNQVNRGRTRRILGSLAPIISIFGILTAHHVIRELTGI